MTSTRTDLPQESDLFELVIFGWKNRRSIVWGLCFGVILALVLVGLKQRKSSGIIYQVKLTESLDNLYGAALTGNFAVDLLQQDKWNAFFYSSLKQLTPSDQVMVIELLDEIIQKKSPFGLSKHIQSSQGAIFTVRWPNEKVATILNPLLPKALNLLTRSYNQQYLNVNSQLQNELSLLQNDQANASAEILRLASKYYSEAPILLNGPLSVTQEEGQIINYQILALIAGFIPDSEPLKKQNLDQFLASHAKIKLLLERRKVIFGNQSSTVQAQFGLLADSVAVQPIENENTAIRAQLWLTGIVSVIFGGLLGLGVSGLRSYYLSNRQRLWTVVKSEETEVVRGNG